ncbi:MAG: universal stress protein [Pseudomonadales bacterium]|nr:universal stress protein [Pseudomonadales bacterium]
MTKFRNLLVAVDLDDASASYVLASAQQLAPEAAIEVVHVLERSHFYNVGDPSAALIDDLQGRMRREVGAYLEKLCSGKRLKSWKILEGHPATLIQQHADAGNHDLIVLGTHGRHGIKRLLGSTANAMLHGTERNVLAIRVPGKDVEVRPAEQKYRRVLAAIDLSAESNQVLDVARLVAERETAELDIVHVIKPFRHAYAGMNPTTLSDIGIQFEQEAAQQARVQLRELTVKYGLPADNAHVRHGAPHLEIQDLLKTLDCDMLVIGTHGKQGVQLLLGSVANSVIHGVTCDVLAVRIK